MTRLSKMITDAIAPFMQATHGNNTEARRNNPPKQEAKKSALDKIGDKGSTVDQIRQGNARIRDAIDKQTQ